MKTNERLETFKLLILDTHLQSIHLLHSLGSSFSSFLSDNVFTFDFPTPTRCARSPFAATKFRWKSKNSNLSEIEHESSERKGREREFVHKTWIWSSHAHSEYMFMSRGQHKEFSGCAATEFKSLVCCDRERKLFVVDFCFCCTHSSPLSTRRRVVLHISEP